MLLCFVEFLRRVYLACKTSIWDDRLGSGAWRNVKHCPSIRSTHRTYWQFSLVGQFLDCAGYSDDLQFAAKIGSISVFQAQRNTLAYKGRASILMQHFLVENKYLVGVLLGIAFGLISRLLMLRTDYRQYPTYPHGRIIHISLGVIAAALGAVAVRRYLTKITLQLLS